MAFDPLLAYTRLILHCDGANTGTTFTDSSDGRTVTPVGNVNTQTGVKVYGTASAYFDGSGDGLTVADNSGLWLSNYDFTLEAWVRIESLPAVSGFIDFLNRYNGGTTTRSFLWGVLNNAGVHTLRFFGSADGGTVNATTVDSALASNLKPFTFYHFAVSRQGNVIRHFLNGVKQGSDLAFSRSIYTGGSEPLSVGSTQSGTTDVLTGYMDDIRMTIGIARYWADFTPPTEAHSEIGTVWLDNFNGTNGSSTFNTALSQLNGTSVAPYTVGGNAQYSTANKKFGTAALLTDGKDDYITLPVSERFNFGTGDFTIEMHLKRLGDTYLGGQIGCQIIDGRTATITTGRPTVTMSGPLGTYSSAGLLIPANTLYVYKPSQTGNPTLTALQSLPLNTYQHIAICKQNSVLSLFVDGVLQASAADTDSWSISGGQLLSRYGSSSDGSGGTDFRSFNGACDAFRVTKGYARYS